MKLIKLILVIAITLGLSITLTMRSTSNSDYQKPEILSESASKGLETAEKDQKVPEMPSKRVTRFLADERNPRAADHCNKDYALCYILQGKNYTCCNNKCTYLQNDDKHCGFCKNKCKFTQTCCRGECVYLSLDKRHCGACGNRCRDGEYCVYGMCSYSQ